MSSIDQGSHSETAEQLIARLIQQKQDLSDVVVKGMSPLFYAVSLYEEDLVETILSEGVNVDVSAVERDGYTALHMAADADLVVAARALLSHGASTSLSRQTDDMRYFRSLEFTR